MGCIFCGNESASFDVPGIEGKVCNECNKHLSNLQSEAFAESKAYFEIVTGNSATPEAKDYLRRKFSQCGSEVQIHFHETKPEPKVVSKNTEARKDPIEVCSTEAKGTEDCNEIKSLLR